MSSVQLDLIPGEVIEPIPSSGDASVDVPWSIGELRIVSESSRWAVKVVAQMFRGEDYDLTPEYQRRRRWDSKRQSRLIESFILNVPIPPIFLYEAKLGHYEVMDGLQRITTILDFTADRFALDGLEIIPALNNKKYSTLPADARKQLERSQVSAIILLEESTRTDEQQDRMKQLVFERINSGGIALNPQEIRNALMPGPLNDLCVELSSDTSFSTCWGIEHHSGGLPTPLTSTEKKKIDRIAEIYRSMTDVEYVLRFFAMRQRAKFADLPLRKFMDLYMRRGNNYSKDTIDGLRANFHSTFNLISAVLGENAFRRWTGNTWRKNPSPIVYDAISQGFGAMIAHETEIRDRREDVTKSIQTVFEENNQRFNASFTTYTYHRRRVEWVVEAIQKVL